MKKAVIVGSGIGGIATSIRLAVRGFDVEVFEANSYLGGKLTAFESNGYRFDAGPSLFTMPHFVDELFELAGKDPAQHFTYEKMGEACRYFWEDGTQLTAHSDTEAFAAEVEHQLHISGEPLRQHLRNSRMIYESTARIFLEQSLHKTATWLSKDVAKALLKIPQLGLFASMHKQNERALNHPKLVQLFDRFATYNGSNPYSAPGILNVIPHLEHGFGTFFPVGGMHSITTSLVELARSIGVQFKTNSKVDRIDVQQGKATGVQVDGRTVPTDVVVSNMDVVPTYRNLLPNEKAPEKTLAQERSSSALIFYWGVRGSFSELGLHNILFSDHYEHEFEALFNKPTIIDDPTIYIHISSKAAPEDAPQGCENWFVMVNAPRNDGQYSQAEIQRIRGLVLAKVNRMLKVDVEALIETENTLTPPDIESRTSSHLGALYGAASNSQFAAFLRHPNFSKRIRDLYFVGGSVHPGGGIPLCLLSARITADLIEHEGPD